MTANGDIGRSGGVVARYRALRGLAIPRAYPVVQFPNPPLWVAIAAWAAERLVDGRAHDYAMAVGTVGIAAWAWLELTNGVNLFRRGLGAVVLASTIVGLAGRLG